MGRYYSGDIEGKFWFGVQPSSDADFFGVTGYQPNYLEYYFDERDLDNIKEGIGKCRRELKGNKLKIDKFFKENNGYNDEMLLKAGINPELLEWYARLSLGNKIYKCVKEHGYCNFQAEL